jgi:hypothetical protein
MSNISDDVRCVKRIKPLIGDHNGLHSNEAFAGEMKYSILLIIV